MGWRLARALEQLRDEILSRYPGTTFWTIGDAAHRASWSDHNPNAAGVVCAADILGDGGLDLGEFAEHIRTSGHPAFKYVIYDRRIAHRGGGWSRYYGDNPHSTHVHVSVGTGPDGQSTGPYDTTTPWGIGDDDMQLDERAELPAFARRRWEGIGDGRGTIAVETGITGGYAYGRLVYEEQARYAREVLAGQAAILAAVGGADLAEIERVVSGALEKAAEAERAERVAELADLLTEVRDIAAGGATAEEIVARLAERLQE